MRAACLPSTQVTVTVDGHALQELQHTEADVGAGAEKGASVFIESVDGAAFAVELDLEEGLKHYFGSVEFAVYIDGKFMGESVVDLSDGKQNTSVSGVHDNYRGGVRFRRFRFARGEMTNERGDASPKEELERRGEVKAVLTRCRVVSSSDRPTWGPGFKGVGEERIPEQPLEGRSISDHAISDHVRAGSLEPNDKTIPTCQVDYPWKKSQLATFVFKYRSHKDLQIEGVIERSPSPEGTGMERETGIRMERRRSATIVLSSDDEEEEGNVTFVSTRPTKIVVGGVIDLTAD